MKLVADKELENSPIVANCCMNRERNLHGNNGYERDLRFDPLGFLKAVAGERGRARWLDLCCGTAKALIEAAEILDSERMPVTIVGVDLVGMFDDSRSERLELVEASLTDWKPTEAFDLITCVHGLHYIGDKLNLIARAVSWLTPGGRFSSNIDSNNFQLDHGTNTRIIACLREAGMKYSSRYKLLECDGFRDVCFPFRYLGADDQAGPNYTGQAAVTSHYAAADSFITGSCNAR